MKDDSVAKLGGICAILVGISYIVAGVTFFMLPAEQQAPSSFEEFMTSVASNSTVLVIQFWAFGLGSLFAIAAVFAISDLVRSINEGWVRWTGTLAVIGFTIVAVQMLSSPTHIPRLAAGYVQADSSARAAINLLGTRVIDPDDFLGFGAVGVWIVVINWLALRANHIPRPLAYVGLVGGIAYWLVVAGNMFDVPLLTTIAAALGGIILGPIWYTWMGILLSRNAQKFGEISPKSIEAR